MERERILNTEGGHQKGKVPARNLLSDEISRDLKRRGFKYMGSITVYSHLQACGIINDHRENCFRYHDILENYPVVRKRRRRYMPLRPGIRRSTVCSAWKRSFPMSQN